MWAALEGSILLWALVLAGYLAVVAHHFRDRATDPLVGWALVTGFVVAAFFFGLMLGPANPFQHVAGAIPLDGPGPNPLLQNHPLMAFHPPMLYLGYVGFTVPFAFAVAALVTGRRRRGLAGRDPPLDAVRVGLPHRRHRARRVVVLRGARVGRLLGLGPGGERVVPAVAHRHRLPALGDGAGAAGDAAGLEPVAAAGDVLASPSSARSSPARACSTRCTPSPSRRSAPPSSAFFGVVRRRRRSGSSAGGATSCARPAPSTRPCRARAPSSPTTCCSPRFAFVVLLGTVFPLVLEAVNGDAHLGRAARTSTA